ncbi:hypothetical protein HPG69_019618 [Diceros bicornis minor]|uniref:Ectonucleoside triphosphate diphosphohydrolase 1 n=1 Tax=Diceros bicornis minor TaxID=77932 RepID=A0A7J7E613_DICBM|nr:hypothetical protein HPG69_019618 [Diceros bicornis minor]
MWPMGEVRAGQCEARGFLNEKTQRFLPCDKTIGGDIYKTTTELSIINGRPHFVVHSSKEQQSVRRYGIVLDAGSSHTSLYIYKWPAEKENDTGVVHQIEECKVKGPGISKYAQKLTEIGIYLTACMERARHVIPQSQHRDTPVYLGATAGMRLLRIENTPLADKVLTEVTKSLSSYPFNFQGARIITGQEEGAYGWITINYLLGKFTQKLRWLNLKPNRDHTQETYGALDLGGASTQITFVPQNNSIESPDNALRFRLYGKNYSVYTHSFLCYGKDQALMQKLAKDIQASIMESRPALPTDPCFHPGYTKVMNISDLYKSPCTKKFETTLQLHQFQIQGTGNYQQCQQSILQLFNNSYCPYSQCSFNGIFLPPLKGDFGKTDQHVRKEVQLPSRTPAGEFLPRSSVSA